jgi:hypothetical protein
VAKNRWPNFELQSQNYNRVGGEPPYLLRRTLKTQLHWHTPRQNTFLRSQWPSNMHCVCKRPRISRGGKKYKEKAKEDSVAPYDRWVECSAEDPLRLRARAQSTPTTQLGPLERRNSEKPIHIYYQSPCSH